MSNYNIIIEKENLKLLQKNNKIKLEIKSKVKSDCNIIGEIKSNNFYNLLLKLNEDIIKKIKIIDNKNNNPDIIILLKSLYTDDDDDDDDDDDESNTDEDEKYFITWTSKLTYGEDNDSYICVQGEKNSIQINKPNYKKLNIENIIIQTNLENNILNLKIKIITCQNSLPIYIVTLFGKIITKMFNRLLKYYA